MLSSSHFSFKTGRGDAKDGGFDEYLNDVVGFFIIEAVVMNSTLNFRPREKVSKRVECLYPQVEALWEMAVTHVTGVITENLNECNDSDVFLDIKLSVILFMQTLEGFGYNVSKLSELMISLFDRYAELMKSNCGEKIAKIIEDDEYAPMTVGNKIELKEVMDAILVHEFLNCKE